MLGKKLKTKFKAKETLIKVCLAPILDSLLESIVGQKVFCFLAVNCSFRLMNSISLFSKIFHMFGKMVHSRNRRDKEGL